MPFERLGGALPWDVVITKAANCLSSSSLMLILLVGSANYPGLAQHEPDHVTYEHSVGCESFFSVIEPTNVDIASRKVDGA